MSTDRLCYLSFNRDVAIIAKRKSKSESTADKHASPDNDVMLLAHLTM